MFFKSKSKKSNYPPNVTINSCTFEEIEQLLMEAFQQSPDLVSRFIISENYRIGIYFLSHITKGESIESNILAPLQKDSSEKLDSKMIANVISINDLTLTDQFHEIKEKMLHGYAFIYVEKAGTGVLADVSLRVERSLAKAETESLVFGPQVSFTESLTSNLNIVRSTMSVEDLKTEKFIIGERNKKEVRLLYINGVADDENVQTFKQRLQDLKIDDVYDASVLSQLIEDHSYSIFPQFMTTELPDKLRMSLQNGRIGLLVEGSPTVVIGPVTFLSFFESTEDLYMRWNMGTFMRWIRYIAIMLSVLLTPAYVAVLTFHYEVIPSPLLISLGQSRANVPFPPVFEALLFEFVIELLREAGARLPTKVGQTMGIVGGIVIGQAAVQAGFTSNILIIIIALSALGSFTTPSYLMGTAIRIIRFPIIVLAGILGGVGIMFAFCMLLIHLLKLSSLGSPYLSPLYPPRMNDIKYSFIRVPLQFYNKRPIGTQSEDIYRYPRKRQNKLKDIDE